MTDIASLKALAQKATLGPWEAYTDCPGECCWLVRQPEQGDDLGEGVTWPETSREDATYMAAASPDVILRLCEVVEKAREAEPHLRQLGMVRLAGSLRTALESLEGKQ